MAKYDVTIYQTISQYATIMVEAPDEKHAEAVGNALLCVGDYDFEWRIGECETQIDVMEPLPYRKYALDFDAKDFDLTDYLDEEEEANVSEG